MTRRQLPIRWYDLVTFDQTWVRDKVVTFYEDSDHVWKPLVLNLEGEQVYP